MKQSVRTAPPNSMFFIDDSGKGRSPEIDDFSIRIWSTASCIIVGCLAFIDGESEFTLSDAVADASVSPPVFDGMLDTPTGSVEVSTSHKEILLKADTPERRTRVRVWTNHSTEPTRILAVLG